MLPSRHKKSPHDFTQATSTLRAIRGFAGRSLPDRCRNTWFLLSHTGAVWLSLANWIGANWINKDTAVLIITPSKREDTGTWKLLLPTPDPDKEDQTFILLSPVHPCMLKTSPTGEEGLCMLKILLNQLYSEYLQGVWSIVPYITAPRGGCRL